MDMQEALDIVRAAFIDLGLTVDDGFPFVVRHPDGRDFVLAVELDENGRRITYKPTGRDFAMPQEVTSRANRKVMERMLEELSLEVFGTLPGKAG